jgi:hypothetical protein
MLVKNSSDTMGNRTRDLPCCSAVPHCVPQTGGKGNQNLSCCSGVEETLKNGDSLLFQGMCSRASEHAICKLGRKFHLNLSFTVSDSSV